MLVLLGVAALAVLTGVVVVAVGRGGQMADFSPDYPSVELPTQRPIAGTDVALMRLPLSLWGYHVRAVDEALRRVAFALSERDSRIATLEQRIIELRGPRNSWEPERRDTGAEPARPSEKASEATVPKASDAASAKAAETASARTSEKAPEKTAGQTPEKTADKAPETTPETTSAEQPAERLADRDRAEKESG